MPIVKVCPGLLLSLIFAFGIGAWNASAEEEAWEKIPTTEVRLQNYKQFATPGMYDPDLAKVYTLPADGKPLDLDLPHEGKGKDDKPRPALQAVLKGGSIWVDMDGDGKAGSNEVGRADNPDGIGPFIWECSYQDGTTGSYAFRFMPMGEEGKFKFVRQFARLAKIAGKNVLFFDDNGNGRYDDIGKDAVMQEGKPATFLGHQIIVDGKLFEIVVPPACQTIQVRPAKVETGKVDMFNSFKQPMKADNLRIQTVIIQSKDASFSFDQQNPQADVPVGAYDIVFALIERNQESVIMRKGERTSFAVEANKAATPTWGSPIKMTYSCDSDGRRIIVNKPAFHGASGEEYIFGDLRKITLVTYVMIIDKDPRSGVETLRQPPIEAKFEILKSGEVKPAFFERLRTAEYAVTIDVKSGILGPITERQHVSFVYKPN